MDGLKYASGKPKAKTGKQADKILKGWIELYVVYLDSASNKVWGTNDYGYWTGEDYTVCGELFPATDSKITTRTKRYKSRKQAERSLEACLNRGYAYVNGGRVESED